MKERGIFIVVFLFAVLFFATACTIQGTSSDAPSAKQFGAQEPDLPRIEPLPSGVPAPVPLSGQVPLPAPVPIPVELPMALAMPTIPSYYPALMMYGPYNFTKSGDVWKTVVIRDNKEITLDFHYLPQEVANITVLGNIKDILNNNEVFVTFDPKEEKFAYVSLAAADISMHLVTVYGITPTASCTSNDPAACQTRPEKTCEDEDVIYIKQSPTPMIMQKNACVQLQGKDHELLKAMTKMLMVWYGIL